MKTLLYRSRYGYNKNGTYTTTNVFIPKKYITNWEYPPPKELKCEMPEKFIEKNYLMIRPWKQEEG